MFLERAFSEIFGLDIDAGEFSCQFFICPMDFLN